MPKTATLLGFLFLTAFAANAQSVNKISGTVTDEQSKPLVAATVSLLRAKDSGLVKVAISDKAGIYEFVNIKDGNYLLSFTSVGFGRKFSKAFELKGSDIEVPVASLKQNAAGLNNVTVAARKPFVESRLDKTIVNVDASPTSAGTTALDILEKSPGVMVSSEGAISLRGKQGVIVMLDNKLTYLSAGDLANLLRNMPASALDQIEIMTNPSSKYDASGNSGIINIKTKKGLANGFNGSFTLGATTGIYSLDGNLYLTPRSQNSFNFNYKKNKFNFFGNYNPNFNRGRNTMNLYNKQIDSKDGSLTGYTDQETKFKFGNFNQTLKLGLDYQANKKNLYGIVLSGFAFNGHPTPVTEANMYDLNWQLERQLITHTKNDNSFKNITGNLNWRHVYDSTGKELTMDLDIVKYKNLSDMFLETDIYDGSLQYIGHTELKGYIPSNINIYSFKSDYSKPLKLGGRIDFGVKSSYVKNDNLVDYETKQGNGPWIYDNIRSNHFIYEENINAAYISANRKIKKWTVQAGLRIENTNAKGNQLTSKTEFTRDTTNLFPTAFLSYAADKKNTITLSYGKRITRPNYQDLNPFIFFLDTLSYRQGNPNLKPQYTHNLELSHAFMGKFITTLSYNNTDDVILQIIKPKEGSGGEIRYLTPDNVASFRNIALSITAPIPVTKWWSMNFFTTIYNNHYTGIYDTIVIDVAMTSFMANMTNTFTIAKGFTAELSGFYRHKGVENLTRTEPLYQMSFGIQKQIMQGKGTFRFNVRDPFAWYKFEGYNKYGYVDMRMMNRPDVRQVTATFTMRFGKQTQQNQQPRRRALSSQDEQNRVGAGQQ